MGNEQSYTKAIQHPRFSLVQYALPKQLHFQNQSMLVHLHISSKQNQLEPWLESNIKYKHIYCSERMKQILKVSVDKVIQNGLCNESCTLVLKVAEKCDTNLLEQIFRREKIDRFYSEEEMWFMLLKIIKVAVGIYQYGQKHMIGNVHPFNILINEEGDLRILISSHSFTFPLLKDHFAEYKQSHNQSQTQPHAFISPQLIGFLDSHKYLEYPDFPKAVSKRHAEMFCIGMTMLSTGTLQTDMMKCYKNKQNKISDSRRSNKSINGISYQTKYNPAERPILTNDHDRNNSTHDHRRNNSTESLNLNEFSSINHHHNNYQINDNILIHQMSGLSQIFDTSRSRGSLTNHIKSNNSFLQQPIKYQANYQPKHQAKYRPKHQANYQPRQTENNEEEDDLRFQSLFDGQHVRNLLQKLSLKYSPLLVEIIISMIHPNPEGRITAEKIYQEILKPNEKYIEGFDDRWMNASRVQQIQELREEDEDQWNQKEGRVQDKREGRVYDNGEGRVYEKEEGKREFQKRALFY